MKHPYYNPTSAWRWVICLYRLQDLPYDMPLKISPKSSLNTTRVRLFHGRAYVLDSGNLSFAIYQPASLHTHICAGPHAIHIERRPEFVNVIDDSDFRRAYNFIMEQGVLLRPASMTFSPPLTSNQVTPLIELAAAVVKQPAMVTANQIIFT